MLTSNLQKYLLILLSALWVFDCSHIGIQSKKVDKTRPREETNSDSIPDCQKNYTKEGNLISSQVYKTWVKYDHLDFRKGFDFVISTLQSHGH
jgi:hypothetical protein